MFSEHEQITNENKDRNLWSCSTMNWCQESSMVSWGYLASWIRSSKSFEGADRIASSLTTPGLVQWMLSVKRWSRNINSPHVNNRLFGYRVQHKDVTCQNYFLGSCESHPATLQTCHVFYLQFLRYCWGVSSFSWFQFHSCLNPGLQLKRP